MKDNISEYEKPIFAGHVQRFTPNVRRAFLKFDGRHWKWPPYIQLLSFRNPLGWPHKRGTTV